LGAKPDRRQSVAAGEIKVRIEILFNMWSSSSFLALAACRSTYKAHNRVEFNNGGKLYFGA
jgi:hypothetical protein